MNAAVGSVKQTTKGAREMAVYDHGKPIEGTVREKDSREVVQRRRENRRLWKANAVQGRKSGIYGNRKK